MPDDLDAATTVGDEADPEAVGLTPEHGRADLGRGARPLPQRRPPRAAAVPAARRARWSSTGRSATRAATGPTTGTRCPRSRRRTETPFCVYSTSKGMTALVVHMLVERGALALDDRVADHIPEYARHGKGEITIGHVLAHRAGVATAAARGARPRPALRPRAPGRADLRRQADLGAGQAARLPRGLGRLHPRRGRPAGHRQGDPRGARRARSSTRSAFAGPTTASTRRTSTRSGSATSPGRGCCRRSRTSSRGRSGPRSTR